MIVSFKKYTYSFLAIYKKEVKDFFKWWQQYIVSPLITTILYLIIFNIALGDRYPLQEDINYLEFIFSGIIMMTLIQSSFFHGAFSIFIPKHWGGIQDILMMPLGNLYILLSFILAHITKSLMLVAMILLVFVPFIKIDISSISYMIIYIVLTSIILSCFGFCIGIISNTFDQISYYINFIIVPLSFLSGTFYSISLLPSFFQKLIIFNPFFYMIDGFRYAFLGLNDKNILQGIVFLSILSISLIFITQILWNKGYKVKF